jgi:CPA2 family monovalent cation:H+ antiporter-2
VALAWGWALAAALVFGLRAVGRQHGGAAARAGGARRCCETPNGRIAVGWLVVEDLAMVLVLVLLPALAGCGGRRLPMPRG